MLGKKAAQPPEGQRGLAGPDILQAAFSGASRVGQHFLFSWPEISTRNVTTESGVQTVLMA